MSIRRIVSILVLVLAVFLPNPPDVQADIPAVEREALIALYNSTGGANWANRDNWRNAGDTDFNAVGTECTWRGIICNAPGDSVNTINLVSNGLSGNIPPEVGDFLELGQLNLSQNQLAGSIPPETGNLSNLTSLNLSYNQFAGSIPHEIGNLSNLTSLNLSQNQLSGSIPLEFGDLSSLYAFFGESNQLSGSIPAELTNLTNLSILSLGTNQLSGNVPSIGGSNLSRVWLNSNLLTGNVPSWLETKQNLEWLDLRDNQLNGPLPSWLGDLSNIQRLMLSSNRLTGSIPPELGALSSLRNLYLDSNRLTGAIPSEITNLTGLPDHSGLDIGYNGLFSDDSAVADFVAQKSTAADWEFSQTVPPVGVQVSWIGDYSASLSWIAVEPAHWQGGYEVFVAPSGTEAWSSAGWTLYRYETTFPVAGLDPATSYDFAVRTFSHPNSANENKVESDLSEPVTGSTTNNGTAMPEIVIGKADPITLSVSGEYSAYLWSTGQTTSTITVQPNSAQWYWVQVTTAEGHMESASILLGAGDDSPPTAYFSFFLSGRQLGLADRSIDEPTTWSWDFGDGATTTDQSPSHTYSADGSYTVDLQASNEFGTDSYTINLVVSDGGGGFTCEPIWVAAAASAEGLNDTRWATDLGINNRGAAALSYTFQFFPRGEDNSSGMPGEVFVLDANASVVYTDIWGELNGDEGAGAVSVCADDPSSAGVTTRTYNTGDDGTFGQTVIGVKSGGSELIGSGERVRLGFLFENDDFRTNVGFMNADAADITIDAEFFTSEGMSLGTDSITLLPLSNDQWNRAFRRATTDDVEAGYVDVSSATPGASFLTYASMVDNATGDPTTIWPFDASQAAGAGSCHPVWIAAAASAGGLNDTLWATDLGINNLGSDAMSYRFQMLPRGQDNTDSEMSDLFTLGGDMGVAYADVWHEMTGGEGAGAMNVCVEAGGFPGVTSRTYNTGEEGTFGQIISGVMDATRNLISSGETARLGFLFQNDDYRTNIGFMNAAADEITIQVEFFTADGTSLGTDSITLAPLSNDQWNKAFTRVSTADVVGGFVDVWSDTPGASFLTYGSVVDQETGDPSTIWPF